MNATAVFGSLAEKAGRNARLVEEEEWERDESSAGLPAGRDIHV
jgi:hypothetical protein